MEPRRRPAALQKPAFALRASARSPASPQRSLGFAEASVLRRRITGRHLAKAENPFIHGQGQGLLRRRINETVSSKKNSHRKRRGGLSAYERYCLNSARRSRRVH